MANKFIIVTGGVLSSVGKGTLVASMGLLLKRRGYNVTAVKIDPYINVDAGTMNPYMHGEVFVTDDGAETDLDLGHYERFMDINVTKFNNITAGKVYFEVIKKEREGKYLGQTVQIIPHVTDEIKNMIRYAANINNAEITLVEIGGTVGDIESLPFLEAVRQLRLEEEDNVVFVHIALVEYLSVTGELKTKPLQHSVQELRRIGIQPDFIVARAMLPLDNETKRKIALFTNVKMENIVSSYDVQTPYEVPLILEEQGLISKILSKLKLEDKGVDLSSWLDFVNNVKGVNSNKVVNIALIGKYTKLKDSYISIREAIYHAAAQLKVKPNLIWLESTDLEKADNIDEILGKVNGIIVLPGFGSRGAEGKIRAIKFAREHNIPFLGICFGFQLAVVEFARSIGLKGANSTEVDPSTPHPVITLLDNQKNVTQLGGTMRLGSQKIIIKEGTLAHKLYSSNVTYERHRHRYEVNPNYVDILEKNGLIISGVSENGLIEIIELSNHKFFLATQAHPEFRSRPTKPSPIYLGFVKAAAGL
ncbi:CTP synthase [Sulfolobus sp. B1]|uniref:CTP synthase n=1 Tax=Sulfolobaceae TaxID=118883 RepID=UPI000845E5E4|nr:MULTISPECIES: CTP synthase [unclassified Sulfolobus]TRM77790.1 CTP synthase [Sulfolobus sp. A20-N-F8]TRM84211.1 CTP synthase [Sulfolobus sp. F3]TRM87543.1 CTP synthase [Sulfolobus sp. C3]TRM94743.1 CTP synthase [Sulfolobus sp. A20-N-G8]TRM99793.1 CTP synthase [Sulfolobus sp. F1]TRN03086.1 CTP synthase [Sulfolobus sp. E1]